MQLQLGAKILLLSCMEPLGKNENQLEHCYVHKHPVYLYLQRNHHSSPDTVLSRWNLGVGHESLTKQTSQFSQLYLYQDKSCRNSMDFLPDSTYQLRMVYWKIPV